MFAYVGVGPKQFKVHCAAVTTGDKPRLSWGDISFDGAYSRYVFMEFGDLRRNLEPPR